MQIPFSPPWVDQLVIDEVMGTLNSGWITSGPKVAALEEEVVKLTTSKAAVCVNSWTSGAILMLKWFGIGEGDEVIIPAYTYSATALCVLHCGATPIMVDIDDDFCIAPDAMRKAITPRTKAIIPVDIAGWPCNYAKLRAIINSAEILALFTPRTNKQKKLNRILLIADAAHSLGAKYHDRPAARNSDIAIFSFHAVKNLTTAEGGCVCINLPDNFDHAAEYKYLKMYTINGQTKDAFSKSIGGGWKYDILFPGLKINMPDICAAIGLAQFKKYEGELLPLRKRIAFKYLNAFKNMAWFIAPPLIDDQRETSYHLFPLRIKDISEAERGKIIDSLAALGVSVNVHFIPLPLLTCFKDLGYKMSDYPNAYEHFANEISLPIYPQLSEDQVKYIIDSVVSTVCKYLNSGNTETAAMSKVGN